MCVRVRMDQTYQCVAALFFLQAQQHLLETQELHTHVTELEDKLADSRLENTKLKNEVIDQKTNFEIQLCDLQTKVNEVGITRLQGIKASLHTHTGCKLCTHSQESLLST